MYEPTAAATNQGSAFPTQHHSQPLKTHIHAVSQSECMNTLLLLGDMLYKVQ